MSEVDEDFRQGRFQSIPRGCDKTFSEQRNGTCPVAKGQRDRAQMGQAVDDADHMAALAVEGQRLLQQHPTAVEVALARDGGAEVHRPGGHPESIPKVATEGEHLLEEDRRTLVLASPARCVAEAVHGLHDAEAIPDLPAQRQPVFVPPLGEAKSP